VRTEVARQGCRAKIASLCNSTAGLNELRATAIGLLKASVGFERWCWSLGDPTSLLAGGDLAEADLWPVMPRIFALEQWDAANALHVLARGPRPVTSLVEGTGGDLASNQCWDECLRPYGVGDQAAVALRDAYGSWGYLKLWRDQDEMPFTADDLGLLEAVVPLLGSAMRRSIASPRSAAADSESAAAVLVLDPDLHLRSMTT